MAIRSSAGAFLLFLSFMAFLSTLIVPSTALGFNCSSSNENTTCNALIDYVSPNTTTLANISSLFSVSNFYNLLGANSYALSTSSSTIIKANSTIKIPFPCRCTNGTGISNKIPVYTVVKNDGLDHIAREVYSGLVTYQEIAIVNNISNVNIINIGQQLWIPLRCSCDKVDGDQVVHYGHVVVKGSSVEQIAQEYDTTESTLLKLNGMSNANELQASQVLDVPLKVCTSSVTKEAEDYPLLIPNGTYSLTAYNCIQCSCQFSTSREVHCEPTSGIKPTNVSQCPSTKCGSTYIGNTTSDCSTCAYGGYSKEVIFHVNSPNCSAVTPSAVTPAVTPSVNYAPARIGFEGSSFEGLLFLRSQPTEAVRRDILDIGCECEDISSVLQWHLPNFQLCSLLV
ncbi:hypothetical protein NE237_018389 [Protea cynaroides]|uniref:LysM domain-containing protein n=1 Tax=Protea cynaroides TaxID=273540 RepID=A0A9Q0QNY7_9MAGN|nr:hypothetical protein NE237_018389 [Protea cynaroides]